MTEQPETIPQLIARWRQKGFRLCPVLRGVGQLPRNGFTADQIRDRALGATILQLANELEAAAAPLRVQPSESEKWHDKAFRTVLLQRDAALEAIRKFGGLTAVADVLAAVPLPDEPEAAAVLRVPPDRQREEPR